MLQATRNLCYGNRQLKSFRYSIWTSPPVCSLDAFTACLEPTGSWPACPVLLFSTYCGRNLLYTP